MLFLDVKEQPGHFQHSLTREDMSPYGSVPPFPLPKFILSLISLQQLESLYILGGERSHKEILNFFKSQEPSVVWMPRAGRGALRSGYCHGV